MNLRDLVLLLEFKKRGTVKCEAFGSIEADMLLAYLTWCQTMRWGSPKGCGGIWIGTELTWQEPLLDKLLESAEEVLGSGIAESLVCQRERKEQRKREEARHG